MLPSRLLAGRVCILRVSLRRRAAVAGGQDPDATAVAAASSTAASAAPATADADAVPASAAASAAPAADAADPWRPAPCTRSAVPGAEHGDYDELLRPSFILFEILGWGMEQRTRPAARAAGAGTTQRLPCRGEECRFS